MVTCTGHIGIHEGADVRTENDVMAILPNFLPSMGYQYFLSYGAPRARAFGAREAPLLKSFFNRFSTRILNVPLASFDLPEIALVFRFHCALHTSLTRFGGKAGAWGAGMRDAGTPGSMENTG